MFTFTSLVKFQILTQNIQMVTIELDRKAIFRVSDPLSMILNATLRQHSDVQQMITSAFMCVEK